MDDGKVKRQLDWINTPFLITAHSMAALAIVYKAAIHFSWWTLGLAGLMMACYGVRWYHFDPTEWFVWIQSKLHLTWDLERAPVRMIQRARDSVRPRPRTAR